MSDAQAPAAPARRASLAKRALYGIVWNSTLVLFTIFYRIRRFNTELIPATGACLVVANHQSHLDPPLVSMCVTKRPCNFVARIGLFKVPGLGWLISALNSLPIRSDASDIGAIRVVLGLLEQGSLVLMFPEGSRSYDGVMQPYKRGVGLLVKKSRCPVVPVAVEGCFDAWPRTRRLPRLFGQRVMVMVGRPIPHDELMAGGSDAALVRLANEIETMRLELRRRLRAATGGRLPVAGPGDRRADPSAWPSEAAAASP